jgi:hypothetical protein
MPTQRHRHESWANPVAIFGAQVMSQYAIGDVGGLAMLEQVCLAMNRAEALRVQIDADGEVIRSKNSFREHPGLKGELACRAFIVRTLAKLGLNFEPVRATPGRPTLGNVF